MYICNDLLFYLNVRNVLVTVDICISAKTDCYKGFKFAIQAIGLRPSRHLEFLNQNCLKQSIGLVLLIERLLLEDLLQVSPCGTQNRLMTGVVPLTWN